MNLKLSRIVAILAVSFAAACGAPGAYDICNASCDAAKRCGYANDVTTTNCHNNCDTNKGSAADDDARLAKKCKNSGDIRKAELACFDNTSCRGSASEYSSAIVSCLADPERNQCILQ